MSRAKIQKHKNELEFLCTCSNSQRKSFTLSRKNKLNGVLNCLADISKKLLYNNKLVCQLSQKEREKFRKNIPSLKKLAVKPNNKSKVKFIQSQKGGNILKLIWNTLTDILPF